MEIKEKQDSSVSSVSSLVTDAHFFSNQLFVISQEEDVFKPQAPSEGTTLLHIRRRHLLAGPVPVVGVRPINPAELFDRVKYGGGGD